MMVILLLSDDQAQVKALVDACRLADFSSCARFLSLIVVFCITTGGLIASGADKDASIAGVSEVGAWTWQDAPARSMVNGIIKNPVIFIFPLHPILHPCQSQALTQPLVETDLECLHQALLLLVHPGAHLYGGIGFLRLHETGEFSFQPFACLGGAVAGE